MKEIVSAKVINKLYDEMIKIDNFAVHGEITGLTVGIEEFFEVLETPQKQIVRAKKKLELDAMMFDSNSYKDARLFLEYLGFFNEGSMKMTVYNQEKKIMLVEGIDGDEIMVKRYDTDINESTIL